MYVTPIEAMVGLASVNPEISAEIREGFAESYASLESFIQRASHIYASGTFSEIVKIRLAEYRMLLPGLIFFYPVVLSMFLVGFLGLCYVSAIVLLHASGKADGLMKLIAPVGRMALTNYLLHSMIAVLLFHSIGFGLFGKIELWHGILISFLIYALQIPFSIIWLKHFRFGPFEWLWRSLTYLKLQPFKL